MDGGYAEHKQWWSAHVRDQRAMQEAARMLGQGLGNLNMAGSVREGSVASSDGMGGLEVTLNGGHGGAGAGAGADGGGGRGTSQDDFQTPPPNFPQVSVMAPVDLGIRRFSDMGIPQAVNPRVLTTGHLDSFLQPVQPGQAYSAQNPPFLNSHSVPLPAPRNLQGGSFIYQNLGPNQRDPSFLSVSGQSIGADGSPDLGCRRVSTISLSNLSLGGGGGGSGGRDDSPVICGAPMDLLRGRSASYTPVPSVRIPQPQMQQDEMMGTRAAALTPSSALGLDNIQATQSGIDTNSMQGILPDRVFGWDASLISSYNDPTIIPATSGPPQLGLQQQQQQHSVDGNGNGFSSGTGVNGQGDGTYGEDGQTLLVGGSAAGTQDPGSAAALAAAPAMLSTPNCESPYPNRGFGV